MRGTVTRLMLYHGIQLDLGAEFDGCASPPARRTRPGTRLRLRLVSQLNGRRRTYIRPLLYFAPPQTIRVASTFRSRERSFDLPQSGTVLLSKATRNRCWPAAGSLATPLTRCSFIVSGTASLYQAREERRCLAAAQSAQ